MADFAQQKKTSGKKLTKMAKVEKKEWAKEKKSHIKVYRKVFFFACEMEREDDEEGANNKWNYYITDENENRKEMNKSWHSSNGTRMQPNRKSVKRKSFSMCTLFRSISFLRPLILTFVPPWLWYALIGMRRCTIISGGDGSSNSE